MESRSFIFHAKRKSIKTATAPKQRQFPVVLSESHQQLPCCLVGPQHSWEVRFSQQGQSVGLRSRKSCQGLASAAFQEQLKRPDCLQLTVEQFEMGGKESWSFGRSTDQEAEVADRTGA